MTQVTHKWSLAAVLCITLMIALAGGLISLTVADEPRVGILTGKVTGIDGKPLEGAFVSVPSVIPNETQTVRTNAEGLYRFSRVPLGYHEIIVEKRGYLRNSGYSGSVLEGRVTEANTIYMHLASDSINLGVNYPMSMEPGGKKRLYLNGVFGGELAEVRFEAYPYDLESARIAQGNESGSRKDREAYVISRTPVYSWVRTYKTSERDGSFYGYPSTPVINQEGAYLIVAKLGNIGASDVLNVSSLAVVTKRDRSSLLAWAVDFKTGKPRANASMSLYAKGSMLGRDISANDGLVSLPVPQTGPALLVARSGKSVAFANTYHYESEDHSSLIYTDRPIYRPGHTIHFKGIFRKWNSGAYNAYRDTPVRFSIQDPEGNQVETISAVTGSYGTASGKWTCPDGAKLGSYRIVSSIGKQEVDARFSIEEYRKPEYSVSVNIPKSYYIKGEKLEALVRANYYFGAPVANAEVTYTVYRSAWYFWDWESEYESWFDYGENDYGYDYGGYGEVVREGKARTGPNGELKIALDTSSAQNLERWSVEVRVVDPTMREVVSQGAANIVPASFSVQAEPERYVYSNGDLARIDIKTVDWDGKAIPNQTLDVVVEKRIWRGGKEIRSQLTTSTAKTDDKGKGLYLWKVDSEGEIVVTARGRDSAGRVTEGEAYLWVAKEGDWADDWDRQDESLSVIRDKKMYKKGDTARLLIASSIPDTTVLVTVEGSRLLESHILKIKGSGAEFRLRLRDDFLPNVNVSCVAVRNGRMQSRDVTINLSPAENFLTVNVQSSKPKYKPGETAAYTVQTLDSKGMPISAEVSLGVVDESIYALRADSTPDLQKYFWGPKSTDVSTSSSLDDYFYGGMDKFDSKVRKYFPDTAYWNPVIRTDKNGTAKVSFKMPDSLTTWRATARAITGDTKAGSAVHKCVVTKDIIVRLQAPRFFRERDKMTVGLVVHNYTDKLKNVDIKLNISNSLKASGGEAPVVITGASAKSVKIEPGGVARLSFPVEVKSAGAAVFYAEARASDNSAMDALQVSYPVYPHGARTVQSGAGDVRTKSEVSLAVADDARLDSASLRVDVTPTMAGVVLQSLQYLVDYPWGCVEQVTSSFVPLVVAKKVADSQGGSIGNFSSADINKMAVSGISQLEKMQLPDGSWGWYQENRFDMDTTSYVVFSLVEVSRAGITVPQAMITKAGAFLAGELSRNNLPPKPDPLDWKKAGRGYQTALESRAFALMAAAWAGRPNLDRIRELAGYRDDLPNFGLSCLALAAREAGDQALFQQTAALLNSKMRTQSYVSFWNQTKTDSYMSNFAATAMALRVMARAGRSSEQLEPVVRWLATNRKAEYWANTRDTSFVALALLEQLNVSKTAPLVANVLVNGKQAGKISLSSDTGFGVSRTLIVDGKLLRAGDNRVRITREGSGPLYYSCSLSYYSSKEASVPKPGYFQVNRNFYRINLVKNGDVYETKLTPLKGKVKAGEIIRMNVFLKPAADSRYVLVDVPLPSGFEVVSREREYHYFWSGLQIRDDRVGIFSRYSEAAGRTFGFDIRAEVPGELNVMPAEGYAMYEPGLWGRTAESRIVVQ